jgi:3-oxoacyl-[acyl-carrier-protein] synthase III
VNSLREIRIRGITACVPTDVRSNETDPNICESERSLLIRTTGVRQRRVAAGGVTTVDLCEAAARSLIAGLAVKPESVELIVLVTQSSDYLLPASAFLLQHRLGLSNNVLAFDINLGCSGYVYGLATVTSMMNSLGLTRALLLAGDISLAHCSPSDKSTYPLFGDAGSATLLERDDATASMSFSMLSNGAEANAIQITHGGMRNPVSENSFSSENYGEGISRNSMQLSLHGGKVFNFVSMQVPLLLRKLLADAAIPSDKIDYLVLHQANNLISKTIEKKLLLPRAKVPTSIDRFGNTSSASIPLTMASEIATELTAGSSTMLLSGFGVGLSCASAVVIQAAMDVVSLIEI